MKKIHKIKVHSIEPAKKYEGKWVVSMTLDQQNMPYAAWMSHKQMSHLQRNLDREELFAAFDYTTNKDKPRFIWASNDTEWLTKAFLGDQAPYNPPVASLPTTPEPQPSWVDEDLPF
jgi:hypothetical protein